MPPSVEGAAELAFLVFVYRTLRRTSNVVAMAVQRRQGVAHVSMLSGERWGETMLFLASVTLSATAAVFYTFSLRNVVFSCPSASFEPRGGAEFCGCGFVHDRAGEHTVLSAFCCSP